MQVAPHAKKTRKQTLLTHVWFAWFGFGFQALQQCLVTVVDVCYYTIQWICPVGSPGSRNPTQTYLVRQMVVIALYLNDKLVDLNAYKGFNPRRSTAPGALMEEGSIWPQNGPRTQV